MIYSESSIKNKKISFLGLGCWRFGEEENPPASSNPGKNYWNGQKRGESLKILDLALKSGVTHFDTAQAYGSGRSEQITGQRLRKEREKVILATKIIPSSNSTESIIKKIDLILRRIKNEYIDILYLHWPDKRYDIRYAVEALEKARDQNLVRCIGVSNFSVTDMENAVSAGKIDYCQTGYSLVWRHREKDVIPFCVSKGIKVIAYSFFAQGILLKKSIDRGSPIFSSARKNLVFFQKDNAEITAEIVRQLVSLSIENSVPVLNMLFGWAAEKKWLTGIVAGASGKNQFREIIEAADSAPDTKINKKLDNISVLAENINDTGNIFAHRISDN